MGAASSRAQSVPKVRRKHFFGISTSPELHDRLVKLAQDMGLSVSALVEKIIEENLQRYEAAGARIRRVSDVGRRQQVFRAKDW